MSDPQPVATVSHDALCLRIVRVKGTQYQVIDANTGEPVSKPGTWAESLVEMMNAHWPLIQKERPNG